MSYLNPTDEERAAFKAGLHARIAENHRLIYAREHNGQKADELSDAEIIAIWENNRIENDPDTQSMLDMREMILDRMN